MLTKSRPIRDACFCALIAGLTLATTLSHAADILDVSSFMMPPKDTWADIATSQYPDVVVTEKLAQRGDLGFRILHLRAAVKGKKQAAFDLAQSGIVQTGDILLSFRPLWDHTLAYAHMQLGVSHSAVAFVVSEGGDDIVVTLELPISYSSHMNSPEHYPDLDAIHIIRPQLSEMQKVHLEKWARLILSHNSKFEFFSDYSLPMYKRGHPNIVTPTDEIMLLAQVANGSSSSTFSGYCSEFVWALMGLRNCDPKTFDGSCVSPIFQTSDGMLTGVVPGLLSDSGMAQGPEAALKGGRLNLVDRTDALTQTVFVDFLTDPSELEGRMSSGHRKVAENNMENMKILNQYYASGEPLPVAQAINQSIVNNVSPTSFLIRSNAGLDGFKYVGTVIFDQ